MDTPSGAAHHSSFRVHHSTYDALLVASFGGPEGRGDVAAFLENVVRGKNVPSDRVREVAARYDRFGGVSPINAQVRALLAALLGELNTHGPALPVYWGNLNWHPLLGDTLRQMADDGVCRALAFVTSAFGSYPGCRQYLQGFERAREEVGDQAPQIDKLRLFYNHPGFVEATADRVRGALGTIPTGRREAAKIVYTAHSLPVAMAQRCPYQQQLQEACRLVSELAGVSQWQLVYQSRSGPRWQPWLEPDVRDCLRQLGQSAPSADVVIVPIGFVCEHMEVVYDLDVEAAEVCAESGLSMVRASVVGCHPRFVRMIRELIVERLEDTPTRPTLGTHGPAPDHCPLDCCLPE